MEYILARLSEPVAVAISGLLILASLIYVIKLTYLGLGLGIRKGRMRIVVPPSRTGRPPSHLQFFLSITVELLIFAMTLIALVLVILN